MYRERELLIMKSGLCMGLVIGLFAFSAHANDGPVRPSQGGSIKPVWLKEIKLVKEKVNIDTTYDHDKGFQFFSRVKVNE